VTLKSGAVLTARYAIDATGRAAALSRMMTASPVIFDRLVGCLAFAPDSQTERNELLIESFEAGGGIRLPAARTARRRLHDRREQIGRSGCDRRRVPCAAGEHPLRGSCDERGRTARRATCPRREFAAD